MPALHILPRNITVTVSGGRNLLHVLREAGGCPDAPCGGNGTCGKCKVIIDGKEDLACRITVSRDMTVTVPKTAQLQILQTGISGNTGVSFPKRGYVLAIDIGTTSVVCFLLDRANGKELAQSSMRNPQAVFGADVISRIQAALRGDMQQQTNLIREGVTKLIQEVFRRAAVSPESVSVVSLVGNPAMQQLFFGYHPGESGWGAS